MLGKFDRAPTPKICEKIEKKLSKMQFLINRFISIRNSINFSILKLFKMIKYIIIIFPFFIMINFNFN